MSMSNKRIDVDPLTDEEVSEIRGAFRQPMAKMCDLSARFKRQPGVISAIVRTQMSAHEVMMQLSGKYADANKNKPLVQTELAIEPLIESPESVIARLSADLELARTDAHNKGLRISELHMKLSDAHNAIVRVAADIARVKP